MVEEKKCGATKSEEQTMVKQAMKFMIDQLSSITEEISEDEIRRFLDAICSAKRVFVAGAGRSGLVARAFAMRLMHLGLNVYVAGETVTPAITDEDLLIVVSGSGETRSMVYAAEVAKGIGARVAVITSNPESSLGRFADVLVRIKGRTKLDIEREKNYLARQIKGEHLTLAPLGTLFELAAMIFLDGVIYELMRRFGKSEEDLKKRHTIIE